MREQVLVGLQAQGAGRHLLQREGLGAPVGDFHALRDYVFGRIGFIDQFGAHIRDVVLEVDGGHHHVLPGFYGMAGIIQLRVVGAVGIADVQGRLAQIAAAGDGIGRHASGIPAPHQRDGRELRCRHVRTIIQMM